MSIKRTEGNKLVCLPITGLALALVLAQGPDPAGAATALAPAAVATAGKVNTSTQTHLIKTGKASSGHHKPNVLLMSSNFRKSNQTVKMSKVMNLTANKNKLVPLKSGIVPVVVKRFFHKYTQSVLLFLSLIIT